jgi:RND family efflux transporter MFP subunit
MADQLSSDLASLRIPREQGRPRGRALRVGILLAILAGAAAAGYYLALPAVRSRVFKPEVAVTEILLVSPAQESVRLTAAGYVVPQILTKVSAKIEGRIARVAVKEGQKVKAGELLFQLEENEPRSRLLAAQSRVLAARANAEASRAQLLEVKQQAARQRILAQKGAAARATAEDLTARAVALEGQVKAAEAQIKVAQADVELAKVGLRLMAIVAPIDGTVISKPPSLGDLVGPQTGAIVELADFGSLVVEADVPEGRVHLVRRGAPAEVILDAFPDRRLRGEVLELGQRVNRAKATILVRVKFVDAAEGVLPDMAARVGILERPLDAQALRQPPKLVVPASALATRGGVKVVFAIEEGRARAIPVTLGAPVGSNGFELTRGPPAGSKLVREPPETLADGAAIKQKSE